VEKGVGEINRSNTYICLHFPPLTFPLLTARSLHQTEGGNLQIGTFRKFYRVRPTSVTFQL
jgi:hypothetical protein